MAVKKGSTSTTKAEYAAAIKAAEKRGAARIEKLVERTGSPKAREMKRLIADMAKPYEGKSDELDHFYTTVGRMIEDAQMKKRNGKATASASLNVEEIKNSVNKAKTNLPGQRNTAEDRIFYAGVDLSVLCNIFECINQHAQTMIADGDVATEHYGLTFEAIAEKGIREANAAMVRLNKTAKASADTRRAT